MKCHLEDSIIIIDDCIHEEVEETKEISRRRSLSLSKKREIHFDNEITNISPRG